MQGFNCTKGHPLFQNLLFPAGQFQKWAYIGYEVLSVLVKMALMMQVLVIPSVLPFHRLIQCFCTEHAGAMYIMLMDSVCKSCNSHRQSHSNELVLLAFGEEGHLKSSCLPAVVIHSNYYSGCLFHSNFSFGKCNELFYCHLKSLFIIHSSCDECVYLILDLSLILYKAVLLILKLSWHKCEAIVFLKKLE